MIIRRNRSIRDEPLMRKFKIRDYFDYSYVVEPAQYTSGITSTDRHFPKYKSSIRYLWKSLL
jgi:hypothetical protein